MPYEARIKKLDKVKGGLRDTDGEYLTDSSTEKIKRYYSRSYHSYGDY